MIEQKKKKSYMIEEKPETRRMLGRDRECRGPADIRAYMSQVRPGPSLIKSPAARTKSLASTDCHICSFLVRC